MANFTITTLEQAKDLTPLMPDSIFSNKYTFLKITSSGNWSASVQSSGNGNSPIVLVGLSFQKSLKYSSQGGIYAQCPNYYIIPNTSDAYSIHNISDSFSEISSTLLFTQNINQYYYYYKVGYDNNSSMQSCFGFDNNMNYLYTPSFFSVNSWTTIISSSFNVNIKIEGRE